jgi:hypothetical protein
MMNYEVQLNEDEQKSPWLQHLQDMEKKEYQNKKPLRAILRGTRKQGRCILA